MAQGWMIDAAGDTITFFDAPANGAAIVVKEYAGGTTGASDVWAIGAWCEEYGWPAEVEFYADRLVFSNTARDPSGIWFTKTGDYSNFGKSTPLVDDDSINVSINARQLNATVDLVPLNNLVVLTTNGEWKTTGGSDDVLAPTTIGFKPQSFNGSEALPALIVNNTAIYASRGYVIRDIGFSYDVDGYDGEDLTAFADHLVRGYTISEWAFQKAPYSAAWCVRSDGTLLSMTYMREHGVVGWARHTTQGEFESVCVIREGDEDAVYVSVKRNIDGATKRYIERMHSRLFTESFECFFVDSGLTYDGRNTTANTMTLTGSGWTTDDTLTLTASTATFASTDVGDWVIFNYAGEWLRLRITGYTSTTVVSVSPLREVPAEYQATATTDWAFAHQTMAGLDHLDGMTVRILADGFVMGEREVVGGSIELDNPAAVVHIGLGYDAKGQTLDLVAGDTETLRMNAKLIKRVGMMVRDTRNLRVGPSLDNLEEWESRDYEDLQAAPDLLNGLAELYVSSTWEDTGRFWFVQDQPLPATILSVIPDVTLGSK